MTPPQLYVFLKEGDALEPGDEIVMIKDLVGLYWAPVTDLMMNQGTLEGACIRRPIMGRSIDPDNVVAEQITELAAAWATLEDEKPAEMWRPSLDHAYDAIRSHHIDDDCWLNVDDAERHALRLLAAVAKVRAA